MQEVGGIPDQTETSAVQNVQCWITMFSSRAISLILTGVRITSFKFGGGAVACLHAPLSLVSAVFVLRENQNGPIVTPVSMREIARELIKPCTFWMAGVGV